MGVRMVIISAFLSLFLSEMQAQIVNYPKGSTPEEIGLKIAERFIESPHASKNMINYPEVCTWYGALKFAEVTTNEGLRKQLEDRFEPLFKEEQNLLPIIGFFKYVRGHYVDFSVFGSLPLELYLQTGNKKYYDLGMFYADYQWTLPDTASVQQQKYHEQGLSWQTRYWIDDMYMITMLQSKAYQATKDKKYVERAGQELVAYLDTLQRENGLFYHAPDAPFYWARGNGWMAVGMTEMLRYLPTDSPYRSRIMNGYLKMMTSLKNYQRIDGTWGQLVDKEDIWAETSGSAMFAYAFIVGVKHGWLDEDVFAESARKAWLALLPYINEDGDLTEICIGTGKSADEQHYYSRPRKTGDFHGQAPMLWCAYALSEKCNK